MKYLILFITILFFSFISNSQTKSCACCTKNHSEFSFWLGEWEVTNANGTKAGTNTLKLIQDQCILEENWKSASPGYTGTSHSFYNVNTQQWEQLWIDNQGISLHLKGQKNGNKMILKTDESVNKKGEKYINQVTWIDNPDGTVRQLWEVITQTDKGETVSIAFDGLYKRKTD